MVSRGAAVDFLVVDDEGLVLLESGEALRLSPIATAIFQFLETPRSYEDLRLHLEGRFGAPPQGSDFLLETLETLISRGVLAGSGNV